MGSRLAVLIVTLAAACIQQPPGTMLCGDPSDPCTCQNAAGAGAVVVRWRVSDAQVGQLLPRGECCCIPDGAPPTPLAGQQCPNYGSTCPQSPAWLIRKIQLHITSLDSGVSCTVSAPCTDAELTTSYCLDPGVYDLQVTADVDVYDASCGQFVCAGRPAVAPPVVRRRVTAGQATNLDGVVLGVNAPPAYPMPMPKGDGGASAGLCSSPADAAVHE